MTAEESILGMVGLKAMLEKAGVYDEVVSVIESHAEFKMKEQHECTREDAAGIVSANMAAFPRKEGDVHNEVLISIGSSIMKLPQRKPSPPSVG